MEGYKKVSFTGLAIMLLFGLSACNLENGSPPDPPPVPDKPPPPDPPPPPPPPDPDPEPEIPGPGPELYLHLSKGQTLIDYTNSKNPGLKFETQELFVNGLRGSLHVLRWCPWSLTGVSSQPIFSLTRLEMEAYAEKAKRLDRESETNFLKRLIIVNRRCDLTHEDYHPLYCTRSNVRKVVWKEFYVEFKVALEQSRSLARETGKCRKFLSESYDSIKGWCSTMLAAGRKTCP